MTSARSRPDRLVVGLLSVLLLSGCGGEEEGAREASTDTTGDAATRDVAGGGADSLVADTVSAGRYFVRLRRDADPSEVAARHGVEPLKVITEQARAFYAELTRGQRRSLREDSLVVSLAREIHGGSDTARPPPRGVAPAASPDTGEGA